MAAVDGKVLRRSFEDASERSPTHLLQAFASQAKLTLAQVEVDGKSNEIPALPELIDVKGRTVTADAMHAQRIPLYILPRYHLAQRRQGHPEVSCKSLRRRGNQAVLDIRGRMDQDGRIVAVGEASWEGQARAG